MNTAAITSSSKETPALGVAVFQSRREDQSRKRCQHAHIDESQEGQPLGPDPRKLGRLLVAAQRIDAAAERGGFGQERVDDGQEAHGDQHVGQAAKTWRACRRRTRSRPPPADCAPTKKINRLGHHAIGAVAGARAQPHPDDQPGYDNAGDHGKTVHALKAEHVLDEGEKIGDEARRQRLEFPRERPYRLTFEQPQRCAAKTPACRPMSR